MSDAASNNSKPEIGLSSEQPDLEATATQVAASANNTVVTSVSDSAQQQQQQQQSQLASSSLSLRTALLKHPRTLALHTSNNVNQAVREIECDNEETLNSLYLANNISYLVDRDRIIDTPGNPARDESLELDYCSSPDNSYDSDLEPTGVPFFLFVSQYFFSIFSSSPPFFQINVNYSFKITFLPIKINY